MRILFQEPIVLLITIYMSFLYGLLYLFLTAYSLVFEGAYGFNAGVAGLPYFGFITGEIIGFICVVLMNPGYVRKLEANKDVPVPEWRLPLVMVGGISFSIGTFDPQPSVALFDMPTDLFFSQVCSGSAGQVTPAIFLGSCPRSPVWHQVSASSQSSCSYSTTYVSPLSSRSNPSPKAHY